MQRTTRLKLNTARRIVEFCHRYVGRTSPSIAALAARLELLLEAVGSLLARRMADQQECATARNERDHLVAALRPRLIGLIRLADAAATSSGNADLRLLDTRLANTPGTFLPQARTLLHNAAARKSALLAFGLPPKLLSEMDATLSAGESAHARISRLTDACAAARLEVETTAAAALQLIRHIDALHCLLLAGDTLQLEEWQRTAAVAWPVSRRPADSAETTEEPLESDQAVLAYDSR